MVEVSTSILNVKEENLTKTIYNLEVAKTNYIHIDVMDGEFVKNNTTKVMQDYSSQIRNISNIPLDVHLMVNNANKYIDLFSIYEPNIITLHYETFQKEEELLQAIKKIKDLNIKVGLAIKPETKVEEILKYLPYIHLCLIMTVNPGEGGQTLIETTKPKIKELSTYIENNNLDVDVEIDGGINLKNIEELKSLGANIIVAGTTIISSNDYTKTIQDIKK